MHMSLFRNVVPQFPYVSRQRLVFSIAKRLSTNITFLLLYKPPHTHHFFHGNNFRYIIEYFFICTQCYQQNFLEMFPSQDIHIYVPIPANHFVFFFYFLGYKPCIATRQHLEIILKKITEICLGSLRSS